ncbi:ankyrin repeat domain-containing protein [Wolbachia endosymbiont (group A) of Myopa testacea]|uniref:ankyrin repeat domain-containing protein n=1 Tax=Wolbachia endosymbiont (group A) of Myopa testacea TaxID=3066148 RepID=UPI00313339A7
MKEYCEWKDTNFDVGHLFKVTDGNNIEDHTLFNLAIKSNCTNVVNVLISIGPDINKACKHTWTPLLLAIESGNVEILRVLIYKGKTISKVLGYVRSPLLVLAIIDHHLEIAKVLIDGGVDVDEPTEDGYTPLIIAAELGYVEIVQALIDKGADINKGDGVGCVALHPAIRTNEIAACQCIVSHIAKLEVAGLHINQANLQLKNKLINRVQPEYNRTIANSYEASLQKCKKDVEKLAKEDKSLYEFLKESNINKLVSIWEANENISNKFNNERDTDIKERYPEYAHILIHKANEVKKEIFLYNHKPLVDILLTKCGHDIYSYKSFF